MIHNPSTQHTNGQHNVIFFSLPFDVGNSKPIPTLTKLFSTHLHKLEAFKESQKSAKLTMKIVEQQPYIHQSTSSINNTIATSHQTLPLRTVKATKQPDYTTTNLSFVKYISNTSQYSKPRRETTHKQQEKYTATSTTHAVQNFSINTTNLFSCLSWENYTKHILKLTYLQLQD